MNEIIMEILLNIRVRTRSLLLLGVAVFTISEVINFTSSASLPPALGASQPSFVAIRQEKRTVHVLYGLSGDHSGFFSEFEISLKSVLMNSPLDSNLKVHIMADQKAYTALADGFDRIQIATWKTRNQVTVETYNVQTNVKKWQQAVREHLPTLGRHTVGAFFFDFLRKRLSTAQSIMFCILTRMLL
jgi:hypothetical protein